MEDNFEAELTALINKYCMENEWDMPDFLMAEFICRVIHAVSATMKSNLHWHGVKKMGDIIELSDGSE